MGINLGALIAPLVTSTLAQSAWFKAVLTSWGINPQYSWHWGFGAAAVGMFIGLVWYVVDRRSMGDAGLHPAPVSDPEETVRIRRQFRRGLGLVAGVIALLAVVRATGLVRFSVQQLSSWFGVLLMVAVVAFFTWMFQNAGWSRAERKRLVVVAVLFFGEAVFWSVFEQAGSTLNLFALNNTRNVILGHAFPSGFWQSVNSTLIVIFAPIFAWIWFKLGIVIHRARPSSRSACSSSRCRSRGWCRARRSPRTGIGSVGGGCWVRTSSPRSVNSASVRWGCPR